jgi:DNA repair exonuclease SbcCD ATPase subunit
MGAEEKALYEYLLQQKKIFVDKMKDLTIEEIADRQKLYEKENEDRLKAMEKIEAEILALQKEKIKEAISAEKERTKGLIDEVKKRYDAEIKAAEDAANAEIAVYEDKIKAIDALLKAEERQEADEDYQDKINRLKETLKFETDDSNKYELRKEIANLTAENEKRKRKESLEDEKESYREKIDLAKNNLSEQKEALQEKRDAEIAMHEEALESYTKKLEEELSALEKNNKKSIDDLKQTLATQKREYATFLKQKKDDTATNNTEIEKLMNQSTTNILDKLKERVSEFADAGASAGAAWRNAFNEMVADIMSSTDSYSANVASAQAATMMQSPSTTNNSVQLQQIINTPTASPAKVARESKKALENAVRYL